MFSQISPAYDLANTLLSLGLDRAWRAEAARRAALPEGGRIIDFCTGTGELARIFLKSGHGVTGVDFCEEMLDIARKKCMEFRWSEFICADATSVPLPNDSADGASIAFALRNLHHVGKVRAVFEEMVRVVRPGGKVMFLELTKPGHGFWRLVYYGYLCLYLPVMGALVSGRSGAYRYLSQSIRGFLDTDQVLGIMADTGLEDIRAYPLLGGIATIGVARKVNKT